jgi:hypothetical protein
MVPPSELGTIDPPVNDPEFLPSDPVFVDPVLSLLLLMIVVEP